MSGAIPPAEIESVTLEAANAGAAVAEDAFRSDFTVETKSTKTDVVTQIDRDAQRTVVERIRRSAPDDPIVGEEGDRPKGVPASGRSWIVDPIDGTANFVRGVPTFCTAVAAVDAGDPLAAASVFPITRETYVVGPDGPRLNGEPIAVSDRTDPHVCTVSPTLWWSRKRRDEYARACSEIVKRFGDLRRVGCAQAELAMVATGALDGTLTNVSAHPWDTVAGVSLIRAAGGTVTDLAGDPWHHDSDALVATNGEIHDAALAAARAIEEEAD